jgi:hypothetical protein
MNQKTNSKSFEQITQVHTPGHQRPVSRVRRIQRQKGTKHQSPELMTDAQGLQTISFISNHCRSHIRIKNYNTNISFVTVDHHKYRTKHVKVALLGDKTHRRSGTVHVLDLIALAFSLLSISLKVRIV